jgi:ABC-type transport system substrate-binding protein
VSPDSPEYNFDPAKAKALLAEAGYPNGVEFELLIPGTDSHRAAAEALVPMFAQGGLTAKPRVIDSATTAVTFYGRQEGNSFIGMASPFADPTTPYQANLPQQYANPWNTTTPEFVTSWSDALAGDSNEARVPAVHRMIELDKQIRKNVPIHQHTPPTVWTTQVVFPAGYTAKYLISLYGVGVGAA